MANSYVQGYIESFNTGLPAQFPGSVTKGDLLVFEGTSTSSSTLGLSDSQGNDWNKLIDAAADSYSRYFTFAWAVAKATGTCTLTCSGLYSSLVAEYSGVNTLRASSSWTYFPGSTAHSPTISTVAGDLLLCPVDNDFPGGFTYASPWNTRLVASSHQDCILGDNLSSPGGSQYANCGFFSGGYSPGEFATLAFYYVAPLTSVPNSLMLMGCGT